MPPGLELRQNLGRLAARLDLALRGFFHPAAGHELMWDIKHASRARDLLVHIDHERKRALAQRCLDNFEAHALPLLPRLRAQVIHNDLNPHNVLVAPDASHRIAGIIDFGDMVHAPLINNLAVAAAYQLAPTGHPLETAAQMIAAYHEVLPLEPVELDILFDLIMTRDGADGRHHRLARGTLPGKRLLHSAQQSRAWEGLERCEDAEPRRRASFPASRLPDGVKMHDDDQRLRSGEFADMCRLHEQEMIARRRRLLGPAYRLFYAEPVHVVRGEGVWLYDPEGRAYLDVYNNVASVGHCHPHVVEALSRQAATLNTHTRYLHESVLDYAERLLGYFPAGTRPRDVHLHGQRGERSGLAWSRRRTPAAPA